MANTLKIPQVENTGIYFINQTVEKNIQNSKTSTLFAEKDTKINYLLTVIIYI